MQFELLENRRLLASSFLSDAAGLSATNSVAIDGTSYFFADDGQTGRELWKSDGSIAGTTLVKDLTPGADGTELVGMFRGANGRAVFVTVVRGEPENGMPRDNYTLWASDGTSGGTVKLREFTGSMNFLAKQLGDKVILFSNTESAAFPSTDKNTAADGHLYVTDGTGAGTKEIKTWLAHAHENPDVGPVGFSVVALYTVGDRVVFGLGSTPPHLWSTDGTTEGTIDVTSASLARASEGLQVDLSYMVQLQDKVLITSRYGASTFWTADGTAGGTKEIPVNFSGFIPPTENHGVFVNGKYLFEDIHSSSGTIEKTIQAFDVETGEVEAVYTTSGDGSTQSLKIHKAGERAIITIARHDGTSEMWSTDGTAAGNVKLADLPGVISVNDPVVINGTVYYVFDSGQFQVGDDGDPPPPTGWLGSPLWRAVNAAGESSLELWRTDGTVANTGRVRTIWRGDATGKAVSAELSAADGKLLVRTIVRTGVEAGTYPSDYSVFPVQSDDTSAYDEKELTFGREGASARLVNGVLRINGSYNDDRIRVWRSARIPDRLVVEYNGNQRGFKFSQVSRINVDLQDGDDYFQILEGDGQVIRTRTSILGGDGADTLYGATGRDTIYGGNSGDLIYGGRNADVILGGGGNDRINAGAGEDQVAGGSDNDRILGGAGVDVLFGQNAIEMAFGRDLEGDDLDGDVFLG